MRTNRLEPTKLRSPVLVYGKQNTLSAMILYSLIISSSTTERLANLLWPVQIVFAVKRTYTLGNPANSILLFNRPTTATDCCKKTYIPEGPKVVLRDQRDLAWPTEMQNRFQNLLKARHSTTLFSNISCYCGPISILKPSPSDFKVRWTFRFFKATLYGGKYRS